MQITDNFTLEELTYSQTARRKGINNRPNADAVENLKRLCRTVLQPIRDAWGQAIVVTCGYRSPKLNHAVGGAKNSDHLYGCAADIRTLSDTRADNKKLFELILDLAKSGDISCRQIIDEYSYNWLHVSINSNHNTARDNQILHIK